MKKTPSPTDEETLLFRDAIKGTRKIKQDTIRAELRPVKQKRELRETREKLGVDHYFSDEYQPHLDDDGPTRYVREDVSKFELKKLKRGIYPPEIYLDLHGMNQQQAKQEQWLILKKVSLWRLVMQLVPLKRLPVQAITKFCFAKEE